MEERPQEDIGELKEADREIPAVLHVLGYYREVSAQYWAIKRAQEAEEKNKGNELLKPPNRPNIPIYGRVVLSAEY